MTTTPLATELNWVGQRVKLFAAGSVYIVRCPSLDGRRAFLSLAADPKILDTAAIDELIIPEPEAEGDEGAEGAEGEADHDG